jgi:Family of unknown function (DUF5995)
VTASTIPEVIERMRKIEASAAADDGLVCFTRLYREVTEAVDGGLPTFAAPGFLAALDVGFAGLFFRAVDGPPSKAWAPLFVARSTRGIAPIQFALAGMNAHINRDLPEALVAACEARGVELRSGSPEHADFLRVNALLAGVEERAKAAYLTGWVARLDRILHRVDRIDDVLAMWSVERARDAAWTNGEALWALRGAPDLSRDFLATLDRTVGFAGRGLLVPTETRLRRFSRRFG